MDELAMWRALSMPRIDRDEWTPADARSALHELRRLRAQLDLAQAELIAVMRATTGRDTRATLVRVTGMSSAEARRADVIATVVESVPGAAVALGGGEVTGAHLALLAPLDDPAAAADLVTVAAGQSVDTFAKTVDRHRAESDAEGFGERQRSARSVRFFRAEEGCVGLRAVLPPLEGRLVQRTIEDLCDRRWREAHPERAEQICGHGGEPRERRLADALVESVVGPGSSGTGSTGTGDTASSSAGVAGAMRIGVVVVVDEARMRADIAGSGEPVSMSRLGALVRDVRTELYAAVRSAAGSILSFGRSRRAATPLQKLALVARDGGSCIWPGCAQPWDRCDVDHAIDWDVGGATDLENLRLLCSAHHRHRHLTGSEPQEPDLSAADARGDPPRPTMPAARVR